MAHLYSLRDYACMFCELVPVPSYFALRLGFLIMFSRCLLIHMRGANACYWSLKLLLRLGSMHTLTVLKYSTTPAQCHQKLASWFFFSAKTHIPTSPSVVPSQLLFLGKCFNQTGVVSANNRHNYCCLNKIMNTTTVQRRIYDPFHAGFCRDPLWVRLCQKNKL